LRADSAFVLIDKSERVAPLQGTRPASEWCILSGRRLGPTQFKALSGIAHIDVTALFGPTAK